MIEADHRKAYATETELAHICRSLWLFFTLAFLVALVGCQRMSPPVHPNDVAAEFIKDRALGYTGIDYVCQQPGPVAAWAPSEYPLPDPCSYIIFDREWFGKASTEEQLKYATTYNVPGIWKGVSGDVIRGKGIVRIENSFGYNAMPAFPGILFYKIRYRAFGGPDGKDVVQHYLHLRPTPAGWKVFERPESVEGKIDLKPIWSRSKEK
jgi:hypothetical protein